MNVVVLIPIRADHPPALREQATALALELPGANPGMEFDIHLDDTVVETPASPSRYAPHAAKRNYMLDTYLRPQHAAVLWVDSDLIAYDADLPSRLHRANPGGITAPLPLLAPSCGSSQRFYDIAGFIEDGVRVPYTPPYFKQTGEVITLDCVGCFYLAPAQLYRDGARYRPALTDYYVEHWSVMRTAEARGIPIRALTTARVIHAWLPDYGLRVN